MCEMRWFRFRLYLALLLGTSLLGAHDLEKGLASQAQALLGDCLSSSLGSSSAKQKKEFVKNINALHLDFIKKYGKLTVEQFRALPEDEQAVGEVIFPQSLPKNFSKGLPMESFSVCAADHLDLLEALRAAGESADSKKDLHARNEKF